MQTFLQRVAVELGQAARHGEGADIDEGLNLVRLKRREKVFERASGMSDGVESGQQGFDAEGSGDDACESGDDGDVLIRKNGAQIEEDAAFFYSGDDGRIGIGDVRRVHRR